MKICIFSTTYFPKAGGAERFIHGLAENLVKRGHKVFVLVPYDYKLKLDKFLSYKILNIRLLGAVRRFRWLSEFVLLCNLVLCYFRYRFDVVQVVILYPAGYAASVFTRIFKVPSVLRPTGEDIQMHKELKYGLRSDPYIDAKVRAALKYCTKVIAISPSIEVGLLSLLGYFRRNKVVAISNGVDLERFDKDIEHSVKKDLGIAQGEKVLISIGRNHPKKDYKTLIKAFNLAYRMSGVKNFNLNLVIIGGDEGPLNDYINSDVKDRVFLLGQIPKDYSVGYGFNFPPQIVIDYLKTSNVYVSASLVEGSPNVILEAIAARLPILAVDAPGTRDYVKNGENGVLVKSKDVKVLARAMLSLAGSRTKLAKFSNFNSKYRRELGWDVVASQYINVYNMVMVKNYGKRKG